jgi:hypothetical protein
MEGQGLAPQFDEPEVRVAAIQARGPRFDNNI